MSTASECKFRELFEDNNQRLSSSRVSTLFGTLIGAVVILGLVGLLYIIIGRGTNAHTEWMAQANTAALGTISGLLGTVIGLFFALCAGVYGMAKFSDNSVTKTEIKAANPEPPAPPANLTVNQPEKMNVSP